MADLYCYRDDTNKVVTFSNENISGYQPVSPLGNWLSGHTVKTYNDSIVKLPANCRLLFSGVLSMDPSKFDTSEVTNMTSMFFNSNELTSIDLSSWDTSNVTTVSAMFYMCARLTSVNFSGWNTSGFNNPEAVSWLFRDCYALESADLSGWNVSSANSLDMMFQNCAVITSINLLGWDVSNVASTNSTFQNCRYLTTITVDPDTNWNNYSIEASSNMFLYCESLPNFNPDEVMLERAYSNGDGQGYFTAGSYTYKAYLKENGIWGPTQLYNKDSGSWKQAQIYLL